MKPTVLLGSATIPDTRTQLMLYRHDGTFSISIPGRGELMNSRVHGSEKALATLACERMAGSTRPRLLIGGLGMGFTLAAALRVLGPDAEVVVAELVPEVVEWNRGPMGEPAGQPLNDPRSTVYVGDVGDVLRARRDAFDAILLDVDNGPEALIRDENNWLYTLSGLNAARTALRPGGVLAVWSAGPDRRFTKDLQRAGFRVEVEMVRPHRAGKGPRHYIWLGFP